MRSFAFVLSLVSLSSHCTDGFSTLAKTSPHVVSNPSRTALSATNDDFRHKAASFAVTLALGWAVGSSSSLAAPLSSNDWTTASSGSSSSFVVAFSDSDFADFSLPSYKEVTNADVNSNLKGGKQLFGDDTVSALSSPSGTTADAPAAVQKKELTPAELKAKKAAAKAAQNAARAAQQAAVEAAAAAK